MPVCPACKTEQEKRVKGACPNCQVEIEVYKGYWFRSGIGSPPKKIIRRFEELVTHKLKKEIPGAIFSIPKKGLSFSREQAAAERLLSRADYDLDVVMEALEVLFTDKRFEWKTRSSITHLEKDYPLAMAIAKATIDARKETNKLSQSTLDRVMSREDIFS